MTTAERLQSAWYGTARAPWWTGPLSWLYGALTALRRGLYRADVLRSTRLSVPVIVIGNLSVGGTGKTPLTIALAEGLRERGYSPGVVSRGYGGTQKLPLLLDASAAPAQVGDEPCLIRASGVPVAVGRDRPAAAKLLIAAGCDVVIADDGLQHYALARDLEICVIDGVRRFGNGRLLPAGPLREPMSRLQQVDYRVCNGGAVTPGDIAMELRGGMARALVDDHAKPLVDFAGQTVHAVAAIGNPAGPAGDRASVSRSPRVCTERFSVRRQAGPDDGKRRREMPDLRAGPLVGGAGAGGFAQGLLRRHRRAPAPLNA